jgi:hypothetical protein
MKTLITIIALFASTWMGASSDPDGSHVVFASETVEVKIANEQVNNLFEVSTFNFYENKLQFETKNEIAFIQIFDSEGKLSFQLPVMSNKLKIGKSVFGEGDFRIGFLMSGETQIQFADVNFKS